QIVVANRIWWELERRLVLVYRGRTHASSDVHKQVIAGLEARDSDKSVLEPLRRAARDGKDAVYAGDFQALGRAMIMNTEAQEQLHPALVSDAAKAVIELARAHDCVGWKVNGAGGEGGSLTILCGPEGEKKRRFIEALPSLDKRFRVISTYLSRTGLRCWETEA
ncbi:MAG TPA: GHMP kinase, partial [Candidatus Hydrogenedentes bacterium]|nr:GHMP kinase [Candidatus Hydrogenedentota bacterium]